MQFVNIRNALATDYSDLNTLYTEGDSYHHDGAPHSFAPVQNPARTPELIRAMIDDPNQELFVAQADDRTVGLLHLTFRERQLPMVPKLIGIVSEIVVAQDHRGSGIGRQLMTFAEQIASSRGAVEIWLDVWEFNKTALGFYDSLGYEPVIRWMRKEIPSRQKERTPSSARRHPL